MTSSNNQIEEIKNRLDIVNVVGRYVNLKQTGKNYVGLCPFHNEKTPSFVVSPDIQRYKCFGCLESGDIFNFLQKIENIDFPEALEKLAKEAGVELKKQEGFSKYKILEEINYKAARYYYNQLKKDKIAMDYLEQRGFNKESIKNFGIGYAPRRPELRKYLLRTKNYSQRQLLDSGLFTLKDKVVKEKFYDRIMFPIRSTRGKVLGFTGRVLPGNNWGPKYMNSPDTPIFHKRENLFGQYESRQEIRKKDLAILCEGSTDVVSAHQHGIKNIVAPLGTGLTKEQLEKLSKTTKNILFFFDSDKAGQEALIRGFKIASELGLVPYAASPKPYKDIDELLQKETKLMKRHITNKAEAFSFILSTYLENKNLNRLEDINEVKNFIGHLISSVSDKALLNLYKRKSENLTKLPLFEERLENPYEYNEKEPSSQFHMKVADNKVYRGYLQLLLLLDEITEEFLVDKKYILPPILQQLYAEILENYKKGKEELYSILHETDGLTETFEDIIFDLTTIPKQEKEIKEELKKLTKRIYSLYLKEQQKILSQKIAIAEERRDTKGAEKYLKELAQINKLLQKNKDA
ncbi:MAG: DNA primase [candidate division WS6 bacterium 36_33]|uniref:DNA primase n=1 Tax=candidate division WS6 bacterium 36_33 TaxID=1641388 RepID=A0A101GZ00_9BACT|nr:MAG: DNA primase [candidate division WS6 bacterium 36_33]